MRFFLEATLVAALAASTSSALWTSEKAGPAQLIREEGSVDTMGSVTAIVAYGEDAARLRTAIADALAEATRLDAMLSNYKPQSEWSRVNRLAAHQAVPVSHELFQLLAACLDYSRESEGTFDISVGPLMKVWGFYKGSGHLAERSRVFEALDSVGYRNIILDPQQLTIRFAKEGVELDPGGIAKGYAVDRMVDVLRSEGVRIALVSVGGSSIYALGAPPHEKGWKIELKDPKQPANTIQNVNLRDESLSTSGSYERFFYADGKVWSHIMDPRTGYPSEGMLSVSVVAPKTIDSEAWAKPYYILGKQWTEHHKEKGFRVFVCEDKPATSCSWVE